MLSTVLLVVSVVVSVQCVQQRSDQLANRNADRLTSDNPWRASQRSGPGQPWTSSDVTARWQHLPSVNKWKELHDNYRWNTQSNDWKPNMLSTSSKWRRNLAFGRNKFNNQEMNGRRIKYWMQGSNKIADLFKEPVRYKAEMKHKATYTHPEGINRARKNNPWYQVDADGNIFVFDQITAMNYEPKGSKMSENKPAMFNKAGWDVKAPSNKPLIMPYAVPEHLIVPVLNPMQIRMEVPMVHNIPYTIEKSVPFPLMSEVPKLYHKLVPISAAVPQMVPYEVHLYPDGRKWH